MSKPLVAIVGRPNVGKSTLFNRLIGRRVSIVEDTPGVTRDRIYGDAEWLDYAFTLIDTGGIEPASEDQIAVQMRRQAELAIETADVMNIGVHPAYRQQGIGRMLLNALMDEAKQRGCQQMLLEVRESNQIAIQLYKSCGFSQISVRKKYYSQPMEDGLVMQCDLKRN